MKTALLLGGVSPEREVSLMSGRMCGDALQRLGVDLLRIDPQDKNWINTVQAADRVFNILHGGAGEDGTVRGLLNSYNIPSTGSSMAGCVLSMDKIITKTIWQAEGLPTAPWQVVTTYAQCERVLDVLPLPYFVKPASGGSSLYAARIETADAFRTFIKNAPPIPMLVEELIVGTEYTLSVLNDEPLPLIRITAQSEFYDYQAKYISDSTRFDCPCGLEKSLDQKIVDIGMAAFFAVQCGSWGRVDLILSEDNMPVLLEVNSVPGMTSHSLVPMAAKAVGIDFDELVRRILEGARVL